MLARDALRHAAYRGRGMLWATHRVRARPRVFEMRWASPIRTNGTALGAAIRNTKCGRNPCRTMLVQVLPQVSVTKTMLVGLQDPPTFR